MIPFPTTTAIAALMMLTMAAFSTSRAAHKETYLWTTFAGNTGGGGATDGPVATAHFAFPYSIASDAADSSGNFYLVEY